MLLGVSDGHIFFDFSNYWPIINANIFYFAPLEHTVYLFFFALSFFIAVVMATQYKMGVWLIEARMSS